MEASDIGADREGRWDRSVARDCPKTRARYIAAGWEAKELDATKPLARAGGDHDLNLTALARHANTRDRIRVATNQEEHYKRQKRELSGKNTSSGTATRPAERIATGLAAIPDLIRPLVRPPAILMTPRRIGTPAWRRAVTNPKPAKPHRHPPLAGTEPAEPATVVGVPRPLACCLGHSRSTQSLDALSRITGSEQSAHDRRTASVACWVRSTASHTALRISC